MYSYSLEPTTGGFQLSTAAVDGQYPIDGYGGSLYDSQFPVPVYHSDLYTDQTLAWHDIDDFYQATAKQVTTNAIAFAVCLITLLNLVALTPSSKRRTSIHVWLVSTLILHTSATLVRMIILIHSPAVSAYATLTLDFDGTNISTHYQAMIGLLQTLLCLSFCGLQTCLFLQSKVLLLWLKMKYRFVYLAILVFLILTGLAALCLQMATAVEEILGCRHASSESSTLVPLFQVTRIVLAISIGGWSAVFFVSAIAILVKRRHMLVSQNTKFELLLIVMAIFGLESFIIPLFFCSVQLLTTSHLGNFALRDIWLGWLVTPSVLFVLPFGLLFPSAHANVSSDRALHRDDFHLAFNRASQEAIQNRSTRPEDAIIPQDTATQKILAMNKATMDFADQELLAIDMMDKISEPISKTTNHQSSHGFG